MGRTSGIPNTIYKYEFRLYHPLLVNELLFSKKYLTVLAMSDDLKHLFGKGTINAYISSRSNPPPGYKFVKLTDWGCKEVNER